MTTWKDFVQNGAFFFTPDQIVVTDTGVHIAHEHEGHQIEGDIQCSEEEAARLQGHRCKVQIIAGQEEPSIVAL